MRSKVQLLTMLIYDLNEKTKDCADIEYSGNTHGVFITVYEGGYESSRETTGALETTTRTVGTHMHAFLNFDDANKRLDEMISYVKRRLENADN